MRNSLGVSVGIGLCLLAVGVGVAQDTSTWVPMYQLLELRGLGDAESRAYAVNDSGQTVGWIEVDDERHAAHWLTGTLTDLNGTVHFALQHPYVLFVDGYSEAFNISRADQVVGTARTVIRCPDITYTITNSFLLRPAVLSDLATPIPGDALTNLMTFDSPCDFGYDSAAIGISNTNLIVGWADAAGGVTRAFLLRPENNVWVDAQGGANALLKDLGTVGGSDPVSSATAVNDSGLVTGWCYTSVNGIAAYRAFVVTPQDNNFDGVPDVWFVGGAQGQNTLMQTIPTLPGGNNSWGRGINNAGVIVGESDAVVSNTFVTHAFRYANGTITDLGTLHPANLGNSAAASVNSAGQVVGWAENAFGKRRAFVYKDGAMQDLNTLLYLKDPNLNDIVPSIELTEARDINENGVIVGWGTIRGTNGARTRGFLLNPVLVNPAMLEDPNAVGNQNSSGGGGSTSNYNGTPIFGVPQHLVPSSTTPDPNATGGGGSVSTPVALCGFGSLTLAPATLLGLAAMRGTRGRARPRA